MRAVKARVTKEMIVEAGMMIVRDEGEEKLSVRNIAGIIGCSTQPIMYCFPTTAELKSAVLEKANEYHTDHLTKGVGESSNFIVGIGLNYIRFAAEERNLFKFILNSDNSQGLAELINSDDAGGLLLPLMRDHGLNEDQARDALEAVFAEFHGYAAMMAFSSGKFDLIHFKRQLLRVYFGVIGFIKGGERPETVMLV